MMPEVTEYQTGFSRTESGKVDYRHKRKKQKRIDGMDIVIAILALIVSAFALISNFTSNKYERHSFQDQVYQRFAQMWFDMDQIFITHPNMHKYFYRDGENKGYELLTPEDENFELGICISEMFCDVFQYSEPLEKYLLKDDRESYEDYKKMIMAAPIVQSARERLNWHEKEKKY